MELPLAPPLPAMEDEEAPAPSTGKGGEKGGSGENGNGGGEWDVEPRGVVGRDEPDSKDGVFDFRDAIEPLMMIYLPRRLIVVKSIFFFLLLF